MEHFSIQEYTNMVLLYGEAVGNAQQACRLYAERYPDRRTPHSQMFTAVVQRLRDTGSVIPKRHDRGLHRRNDNREEDILRSIENNPSMSTSQISRQVGVSKWKVWSTLHEQLLYPYHFQRVQCLSENDYPSRRAFCEWVLNKHERDGDFLNKILVTDEAGFTRDGIFNYHNTHVWADENPHAICTGGDQQRFTINVWAGIVGDHIIGPYVLPRRLSGEAYANFLTNILPELLEEVPLNVRQNMWYQHDGAPAHFDRNVRNLLNNNYNGKWIGRGGPVAWPPRSPDLTPMDFYFWGHLKSVVYSSDEVTDENDLHRRILNGVRLIKEDRGVFERIRQSWLRRLQACVRNNGGPIEHLI